MRTTKQLLSKTEFIRFYNAEMNLANIKGIKE